MKTTKKSTRAAASPSANKQAFEIRIERESDGRWLAEAPELSGVMAYGKTRKAAEAAAYALALRVIADRIEESQRAPKSIRVAVA